MRMLSIVVVALGLCACSFTAPLSGPRDTAAPDAVARNPDSAETSEGVTNAECVNSCRVRADSEYNICRSQTPGNESNCALVRDRVYAECPGECG